MTMNIITKSAVARFKHFFGKNTPLRVLHRITTRCNLKCSFCDHQLHHSKRNELTTIELKDAMRQFSELGTIAWGITGGEPFLRKDLPEIISYSKQLGFLTSCITNGTVHSTETLIEVAKSLDYLVTSLEGSKQNTDKIRGEGTFDKVVSTIEVCNSNDLPVIVGVTLTRDFIEGDGLNFMGKFCKEMGVRCSFQNLLLTGPYGGAGFSDAKPNIVPHEPSKKMLFDAMDRIIEMRERGYHFVNNEPWVDYVKAHMNGTLKPSPCFAGKLYCNFYEDGSLRTCQYHPRKIKNNDIAESFYRLPGKFDECPCVAICYVNYNLALSFNPQMIIDGLKNTLARGHRLN